MAFSNSQLLISPKKPKLFRMKHPPLKPKRIILTKTLNITYLTLADILGRLPKDIRHDDICFVTYGEDDDCSIYAQYSTYENTEEYGKRHSKYLEELEEYNLWFSVNKSLIEQKKWEEEAKKEKAKEARKEITQRKKQERIAWLQKELEKELKQ